AHGVAAHVRHGYVGADQIGPLALHLFEAIASGVRHDHRVAMWGEHRVEQPCVLRCVVDDEDRRHSVGQLRSSKRRQYASTCPGNALTSIGFTMTPAKPA